MEKLVEGYFLDIEEDLDNDDVDEGHLLTKETLRVIGGEKGNRLYVQKISEG